MEVQTSTDTELLNSAATQTPEMPRRQDTTPNDSSIMVYKLDTQKPLSELEQDAKNLAIPDVVVEYIRDSLQQDGGGVSNPAFEPQELIVVRTPSSISLREDANKEGGLGGGGGGMMYLEALNPSLRGSQASLVRSVPPSPNFGYRPLESETSAVYTIISPVRYVGGGGKEDKERELRLMEQLQAQMEKEKATSRRFEFVPDAPEDAELKRKRLQGITDFLSLVLLVPGILIGILTPLFIIPMFIFPLKYYIPLIGCFGLSGGTAAFLLAMSGLVGNVVWHWDTDTRSVRPRLHCGTGPIRHFFGNGFYKNFQDVHTAPLKGV